MKILIVKTSAFGDIVQSFDALEYLKEKFPGSKIDWVASSKNEELVKSHPLVDKALCFDLNKEKKGSFLSFIKFIKQLRKTSYDVVFDLQGNSKSGLITFLSNAKNKVGFGAKGVAEWPNLLSTNFQYNVSKTINIRAQNLQLIQSYFLDDRPFFPKKRLLKITRIEQELISTILKNPKLNEIKILICPGSKWKNKELDLNILLEFMELINKNLSCSFLLLWGNEKEKKTVLKLSENFSENSLVLEKLSLPALQNLIHNLSLVVAMDSGPLHLAGSADAPSFSFFGPTSANVYKPLGSKHFALQGKCPTNLAFSKRCPLLRSCPTGECMNIEPKMIFEVFMKWWESLR